MKRLFIIICAVAVAAAHAQTHDPDKAIAEFTETLRLNPKNAEVYHLRGLAYGMKGNLKIILRGKGEGGTK